ncbi:MAG TPA: hypothetical protein VMW38_01040 [Terriglobia bacterium]|nr:hypothetical protein [Terriglobia bacterium]
MSRKPAAVPALELWIFLLPNFGQLNLGRPFKSGIGAVVKTPARRIATIE